MKTMILLACLCCTLFSCENVEKKAGEKLQTAVKLFNGETSVKQKCRLTALRYYTQKLLKLVVKASV